MLQYNISMLPYIKALIYTQLPLQNNIIDTLNDTNTTVSANPN